MAEEETLLEKIYKLTTESRLADEKLNSNLELMNKRIEALEKLSVTMAENLNDMKHLQTVLDSVTNLVHQNTNDIKDLKKKYYDLEQKPMKDKANKWQYIVDYAFKGIVGAVLGVALFKLGFGGK